MTDMGQLEELKAAASSCSLLGLYIPDLPVRVTEVRPGRFCVNVPGSGFSDRPFGEAMSLIHHLTDGWRAAHIVRTAKTNERE